MPIPGGTWQLALKLSHGWRQGQEILWVIEAAALALCLVLALLVLLYQRSRRDLETREEQLRAILQTTRDGILVYDHRGRVLAGNPAACKLMGYSHLEMRGKSIDVLIESGGLEHEDSASSEVVSAHGYRKDGSTFPAEVTIGRASLAKEFIHVCVVRDATERHRVEQMLRTLATTDDLTGAKNRRAIVAAGESTFRLAQRHDRRLSLLIIDADHFKRINDVHGHAIGDEVLVALSRAVMSCLRETDTFGRIGGEEFATLLPETDAEGASTAAQRILNHVQAIALPLENGETVQPTVSIGIATSMGRSDTFSALMRRADEAPYCAKRAGRNRFASA